MNTDKNNKQKELAKKRKAQRKASRAPWYKIVHRCIPYFIFVVPGLIIMWVGIIIQCIGGILGGWGWYQVKSVFNKYYI